MSVKERAPFITGAEFGEERRRLVAAGYKDDSPELKRLWNRVRERDEFLWLRYGRPLMDSHLGQWVAISPEGNTVIRATAGEAMWEATRTFGEGNYCIRK